MKLIFLGSGSAFTPREFNYQSNMVLQADDGHLLLIDCGTDARFSLQELGFDYRDVHDVYISHSHADHAGGLEWLCFSNYFYNHCAHKPTLHVSKDLGGNLWEHTLSGGLSSLEGEEATLETYFNVDLVDNKKSFTWKGIQFYLIKTIHVMNAFSVMPSYGLLFKINDKSVYITTDTQFIPEQLTGFYEEADIIFQDCETSKVKSGVHAHYDQLIKLDDSIKQKMWLYHYSPGDLPDAKEAGFLGFVKRGQCFEFY